MAKLLKNVCPNLLIHAHIIYNIYIYIHNLSVSLSLSLSLSIYINISTEITLKVL